MMANILISQQFGVRTHLTADVMDQADARVGMERCHLKTMGTGPAFWPLSYLPFPSRIHNKNGYCFFSLTSKLQTVHICKKKKLTLKDHYKSSFLCPYPLSKNVRQDTCVSMVSTHVSPNATDSPNVNTSTCSISEMLLKRKTHL